MCDDDQRFPSTSRDLHDIVNEALSQPVKPDRPDRGGYWGGIKTWWRKLTRR